MEGKEKEGEKYQCVVASHVPPTTDLARNPGMCPSWESNQWPFGSQAGTPSTEPHQPGLDYYFPDIFSPIPSSFNNSVSIQNLGVSLINRVRVNFSIQSENCCLLIGKLGPYTSIVNNDYLYSCLPPYFVITTKISCYLFCFLSCHVWNVWVSFNDIWTALQWKSCRQ